MSPTLEFEVSFKEEFWFTPMWVPIFLAFRRNILYFFYISNALKYVRKDQNNLRL